MNDDDIYALKAVGLFLAGQLIAIGLWLIV